MHRPPVKHVFQVLHAHARRHAAHQRKVRHVRSFACHVATRVRGVGVVGGGGGVLLVHMCSCVGTRRIRMIKSEKLEKRMIGMA